MVQISHLGNGQKIKKQNIGQVLTTNRWTSSLFDNNILWAINLQIFHFESYFLLSNFEWSLFITPLSYY
jgi:hypothetical protein